MSIEEEIGRSRQQGNQRRYPELNPDTPDQEVASRIGTRYSKNDTVFGPWEPSHIGVVRSTGKPCRHWVQFVWVLQRGDTHYLGLSFISGFRCWYPATASDDWDYHNNPYLRAALDNDSTSSWLSNQPWKSNYTRF